MRTVTTNVCIFLFALVAFSAIAEADEEGLRVTMRDPRPARWSFFEIGMVVDGKEDAARLSASVSNGRLKELSVSIKDLVHRTTLSIPNELLSGVSQPIIERMTVYTSDTNSYSAPLLVSVAIEFGAPIPAQKLECGADLRSEFAFAIATFGFDVGMKSVTRILHDPCHRVIDPLREVSMKQ